MKNPPLTTVRDGVFPLPPCLLSFTTVNGCLRRGLLVFQPAVPRWFSTHSTKKCLQPMTLSLWWPRQVYSSLSTPVSHIVIQYYYSSIILICRIFVNKSNKPEIP